MLVLRMKHRWGSVSSGRRGPGTRKSAEVGPDAFHQVIGQSGAIFSWDHRGFSPKIRFKINLLGGGRKRVCECVCVCIRVLLQFGLYCLIQDKKLLQRKSNSY